MRRLAFVLVAACLLAAPATSALAWGSEGHRIVATLAYERLTPRAKATVDWLLTQSAEQNTPACPVATLMDAATWPDCVRPLHQRYDYLAVMHYEDVPLCGRAARASYCPNGKCITDETRRAVAILRDARRPGVARLQALEEIAHFVGDMHQPLHAADNADRGGNSVHIDVGGRQTNLHHIWDVEVLENAVGIDEAAAVAALRPLVGSRGAEWSRGDPDTWLAESHRVAVRYVYPKLAQPAQCGQPTANQPVSQDYLDGAAPIVRQQLGKAAARLARVLNDVL